MSNLLGGALAGPDGDAGKAAKVAEVLSQERLGNDVLGALQGLPHEGVCACARAPCPGTKLPAARSLACTAQEAAHETPDG